MRTLTDEQEAVLRDVLQLDCCSVVTAVPGAGKSTLALELASRAPGRVVVISYNKILELDLARKARLQHIENLEAFTIHSLLARYGGSQVSDDAEMLEAVEAAEAGHLKVEPFAAWCVVIDEAQDLRPLFVRAIRAVLAARASDFRIVVLGDEAQMLYDFPSLGADKADTRFMHDAPQHFGFAAGSREWTRRVLSKSFRLTPAMATFANAFWCRAETIVGANAHAPDTPVNYHCIDPYSDRISDLISESVHRYGAENVLVVGQSTKYRTPLAKQADELHAAVHLKDGGAGSAPSDLELARKVNVSTACKTKGAEYKCVWLLGFGVHNSALLMSVNQMCVALTRGSVELHVVQPPRQHIYPIGGDVARIDETYEVVTNLIAAGIVRCASAPLPRPAGEPKHADRTQIGVTDCTRVCATDLRAVQQALGLGLEEREAAAGARVRRMEFEVGRTFRGLHYDTSDLYGRAVPYAFQASRGVMPPEVRDHVLGGRLNVPFAKHRGISHTTAVMQLEKDGCKFAKPLEAYEGKISYDELRARLVGILRRGNYEVDIAEDAPPVLHPAVARAREAVLSAPLGEHGSDVWLFCAAVVMGLTSGGGANRLRHMGTHLNSYKWHVDELFATGVEVLSEAVKPGGIFEHKMLCSFDENQAPMSLFGIADCVTLADNTVYEIKFTSSLCAEHRFQTRIYAAILASHTHKDARGVLVNARTGRIEEFKVRAAGAREALARLVRLQAP